jgi:hypothetical protein
MGAVSSKPAEKRGKGRPERRAGGAPINFFKNRRQSSPFDPKITARASFQQTV